MRRPTRLDHSAIFIIAIVISILILLASCSIEHRASRIHTAEMNEQLETYYHAAVWDKQNSTRPERRDAKKELKQYYKSVK